MRKYLAVLKVGWLDALEYRAEFFISIFGWGIRLFIAVFLWLAVTESRNDLIAGYTFQTIMAYFFIVQTISSFIFSRVGFDISLDIHRGDFANFLLKPINYVVFRMVHEVSKNAFRMMLSIIIFGIILFGFFGGIPFTAWKIPLSILAIAGAYLVNFCMIAIISLSAFWIVNSHRLLFIYFGILTIFSGMMLPLDLFPPEWANILFKLPFPYIFYFPSKIIQSATLPPDILQGFLIELGYFIVLGSLVIFMYKRGVARFESIGR